MKEKGPNVTSIKSRGSGFRSNYTDFQRCSKYIYQWFLNVVDFFETLISQLLKFFTDTSQLEPKRWGSVVFLLCFLIYSSWADCVCLPCIVSSSYTRITISFRKEWTGTVQASGSRDRYSTGFRKEGQVQYRLQEGGTGTGQALGKKGFFFWKLKRLKH